MSAGCRRDSSLWSQQCEQAATGVHGMSASRTDDINTPWPSKLLKLIVTDAHAQSSTSRSDATGKEADGRSVGLAAVVPEGGRHGRLTGWERCCCLPPAAAGLSNMLSLGIETDEARRLLLQPGSESPASIVLVDARSRHTSAGDCWCSHVLAATDHEPRRYLAHSHFKTHIHITART